MFALSFSDAISPITSQAMDSKHCDPHLLEQFVVGMLGHGVRLQQGLWFMSEAHTDEDVDCTLRGAARVLAVMSGEQAVAG